MLSQGPVYKTIQNWLINTDFFLLYSAQPLPQLGWPPQLLPIYQSWCHAFSWRFLLKMSSHLFWLLNQNVLIHEAPISISFFPWPLYEATWTIPLNSSLSLLWMSVISLLASANSLDLIPYCLVLSQFLFSLSLYPTPDLPTPLAGAPNLLPLLCFPGTRDSASCIVVA